MSLINGCTYRILNVCPEKKDIFYSMGLSVDKDITIYHVYGMKGPVVIDVNGRLIGLRRNEIECLKLIPRVY